MVFATNKEWGTPGNWGWGWGKFFPLFEPIFVSKLFVLLAFNCRKIYNFFM